MWRVLAVSVMAGLVLLFWSHFRSSTLAQRPPELNADGAAYLRVNINPTSVPPMVNINPNGQVPRVEVARMPELTVRPVGCDSGTNYETGVEQRVSGPIKLTFLSVPQEGPITFVDSDGRSFRVTLGSTRPLESAIYLRSNQRLQFDSAVLYSGCRP